jgi:hypothetical protein
VNSESTPPGDKGRDPPLPDAASATSDPPLTLADRLLKALGTPSAGPSAPTSSTEPPSQRASPDRPDVSAAGHRVAAGLPPQPPPMASNAVMPGPTGQAAARDLPMPDRSRLGTPATTSASPSASAAASGGPPPASPGRVLLGAGEPEPPISGRPDGLATSLLESKRITPRSPRAALEPDHVPLPTRPSRRARNPLVIIGNAIFTALVLILILGGGAVMFGKGRLEAPGPLQEDKVVSIPPRSGVMDIAELLKQEGVIDVHRLVFIGGVFALKARSDLKAGEYLFPKRASVKDVIETIVEGKVVQHQITIPEGLTDRRAAAGERPSLRQHQGCSEGRQPSAGRLPFQPRVHARADASAHAPGARSAGAGSVGAPQS